MGGRGAVAAIARPLAGRALRLGDQLVAGVRARRPEREGALVRRPTAGIAAITHWYDEARHGYLLATIDGVLRQAPSLGCAIVTNEATLLTERLRAGRLVRDGLEVREVGLAEAPAFLLRPGHRIAVVRWDHRHHPYRLTWFHKRLFRALTIDHDAFSQGISHLLYLEDDLRLADHALDYWCAFRPLLAPHGLLPGFTRIEGEPDPTYLTDVREHEAIDRLPGVEVVLPPAFAPDGERDLVARCVNLTSPYQAMSVLDAELADEHFERSLFRSFNRSRVAGGEGGRWGVRERAAAGAIFDGVPPGFRSRNVIPVVSADRGPRPLGACLVEHVPATYFHDPASPFAKVPLAAAFQPRSARPA